MYLIKRIIFISTILLGFILYGILFIDNSRSCLGSPKIVPTVFIGLPLLLIGIITDAIVTFFKNKNRKYIPFTFVFYFAIAFLIITIFNDF